MTRTATRNSSKLRAARVAVWLSATLVSAACGENPQPGQDGGPDATPTDAALDAGSYGAAALGSSSITEDGRTWTETRYRVTRPDGEATYVQWIPSDRTGPRPVVVMTMPYAGIDWTGDALDTRWAGYLTTAGLHLDVDGPDFDGTTLVYYEPTSIAGAFDGSRIHRLNDFSVLLVYGRFYAGGDVRDDIADMAAGMWFVAEQANVDRTRIGTFGGSWGGFEALYAAVHADARAPASVVAAMYPPSDLFTWYQHAITRTGGARDGLQGHLHRLLAATGGPPGVGDYSGLHADDLCARLPAQTLLLHDAVDNLVPITQSQALATVCGSTVLAWPRATAIDPADPTHGPILDEPIPQSVFTYATAYLHLRLARPDQTAILEIYHPTSMRTHLGLARAAQLRGAAVTDVAPRLLDLADPRMYLVDVTALPATLRTGASVVAELVNAVWGTSYTEATIRGALAVGLPTP